MTTKIFSRCFLLIGLLALVPAPLAAATVQSIENNKKICAKHTRLQERKRHIPTHLLTAISLTESGRWDQVQGENVAWPWTVTSGGKGQFFDSKQEALAEVEILLTEGVRNIDVGCMQINLHYHADAFETLSDAFDPKLNTAYAAKFLAKLKTRANSWTDAAGTYHSSTPDKKKYYLNKVMAYWNSKRGLAPPSKPHRTAVAQTKTTFPSPSRTIDFERMKRLNSAFKNRLKNERSTNADVHGPSGRQRQPYITQNTHARQQDLAHIIAARQAKLLSDRRKRLATNEPSLFPNKRRDQLKAWREKGVWHGG